MPESRYTNEQAWARITQGEELNTREYRGDGGGIDGDITTFWGVGGQVAPPEIWELCSICANTIEELVDHAQWRLVSCACGAHGELQTYPGNGFTRYRCTECRRSDRRMRNAIREWSNTSPEVRRQELDAFYRRWATRSGLSSEGLRRSFDGIVTTRSAWRAARESAEWIQAWLRHRACDTSIMYCECGLCTECGRLSASRRFGVCPECRNTADISEDWRRDRIYFNEPQFLDGVDDPTGTKRFVGLEWEIANLRITPEVRAALMEWKCSCVADGSVSGTRPVEIRSMPVKGHMAPKMINELFKLFSEQGDYEVNRTCGGHVHVDMRGRCEADTTLVAAYFKLVERALAELIPSDRRRGNSYTGPLTNTFRQLHLWATVYDYSRLGKAAPEELRRQASYESYLDSDRYRFLNYIDAFDHHKTVEFRLWPGARDAQQSLFYARLSDLVVDVALTKGLHFLDERFPNLRNRPHLNTSQDLLRSWMPSNMLNDYFELKAYYA